MSMLQIRPGRGFLAAIGLTVALVLGAGIPAHSAIALQTLTCTSSTGTKIVIKARAKGEVYYQLWSPSGGTYLYQSYVGKATNYVWRERNTGFGGSQESIVKAYDFTTSGGVAYTGGVSDHVPYCTN